MEDPYELKLFQMFDSCDKDQCGMLSLVNLRRLCEMLELDQNALVDTLSVMHNSDDHNNEDDNGAGKTIDQNKPHISFVAFKEALLNFLGTELDGSEKISSNISSNNNNNSAKTNTIVANSEKANSLVISNEVKSFIDSPPESSDREVSPKLIKGSKKYGRRSRPQHIQGNNADGFSLTDSGEDDVENGYSNAMVQRSSSQSDIPANRRRRTTIASQSTTKLKRCASLPGHHRNLLAMKPTANEIKKPPSIIAKKNEPTSKELKEISSSLESLGTSKLWKAVHDIWSKYGAEVGRQYLSCAQVCTVCEEQLGLHRNVAETIALECLHKLFGKHHKQQLQQQNNEGDNDHEVDDTLITLPEFISLIKAHKNDLNAKFELNWMISNSDELSSSVGKDTQTLLLESLPAHNIIDIWERASITNGRGILLALGFNEPEINLLQLNKVLEEEYRNLEDEPQMMFVRASFALQTFELNTLRQQVRQLRDENIKLRANNKDANQRCTMLAMEIDERHASIEDSTKKEILKLEQRHANVLRDLTARMTSDREHWTNLTNRLEERIKIFEQNEIKMKTELDLVGQENNDLEAEQRKLQRQITELLEKNIQLNNDIAHFEDSHTQHSDRDLSADNKPSYSEDVLNLMDKITVLQSENTNLRDKNDELVAEMENLNFELIRMRTKSRSALTTTTSVGVMCAEGNEETLDDIEYGSNQMATKRRGDSPSKTHVTEESPRLGKLRRCTKPTDIAAENSDTSGEWMALNSELQEQQQQELQQSSSSTKAINDGPATEATDLTKLTQKIATLEQELKKAKDSPRSDTMNKAVVNEAAATNGINEERCRELETSLEQMQRAYEDCEDYWQSKLAEERQLFEKERQIYEEEQQENDKKFTELMEKVREYEEQFSKDGRLSPIEEKDVLEQQYIELEAEAEELRENSRRLYEEKTAEIEALQHEVEDLRIRLGESVEILTGACELNTEAATQRNNINTNSPANSPINYLWQQSTIQQPITTVQQLQSLSLNSTPSKRSSNNNLSTSETAIFSTLPLNAEQNSPTVSPIQKPIDQSVVVTKVATDVDGSVDGDTSSTSSARSYESHSIASTHSVHHPNRTLNAQHKYASVSASSSRQASENASVITNTSDIKDELKRLKFFEISLKDQIKDLSLKRDGLVMELQQLHEARPVLEKAFTRTVHPTLIQRVNQLELRNRHLQNYIKQQSQYIESLMQQSWRQHQIELNELHNRIEAQGSMLAEQTQRLQNADILVKDLYVENAHLVATVQRLEQQRTRVNYMHQQQQQSQSRPGLNGITGLP